MPDESEPPRKVYGFKERAFTRDNAPTAGTPPPPTAQELAMMSGPPPAHVKPGEGRPGAAKPGDPNDVYAVLQENRAVEKATGADHVEIRRVSSRRKKEYWLLLLGGNAAIVGFLLFTGLNPVNAIFGLAAIILFSIAITWVMWQVMDRY